MFEKFKNFWITFWDSMKTAYNSVFKHPIKTKGQEVTDTEHINIPDIVIGKLNNLALTEATFTLETDSKLVEPLVKLCSDLEDKKYTINYSMLSRGDCFVFPSTDSKGNLYHSYLGQDRVRILNVDGEQITKACGVLDVYTDKNKKTFYLLRTHELLSNGTLQIDYSTVDTNNNHTYVERWADLDGQIYQFINANHIGFGRYKSPIDSRGLSPVYGVPINFGCSEIERDIFKDLELIRTEFNNAKSKIFADVNILQKGKDKFDKDEYKIPENVFPIMQRAGEKTNIDIFNPNIRYSEHYSNLVKDFALYEKQIGTSKGILTDNETVNAATATAVKRANSDTLALISKIQQSIDIGNEMTLQADGVFLNISNDLWKYTPDYYDPFEDPAEQFDRLITAKGVGAVEIDDIIKWLFPTLDDEQIEEKKQRLSESNKLDTENALNNILNGN